jgi:hypothetical protein
MILTCANCLSASEHCGEIKINFCFHCGYQVNYQHKIQGELKIHNDKTAFDKMLDQLASIRTRSGMIDRNPNPKPVGVDWDFEFKKIQRSK